MTPSQITNLRGLPSLDLPADVNDRLGAEMMASEPGRRARELLKRHGIETLEGGSIAWTGNIMPGHSAVAALLDAAERVEGEYQRGRCDGIEDAAAHIEQWFSINGQTTIEGTRAGAMLRALGALLAETADGGAG